MIETRADVSEALAAFSRAGRALTRGAALEPILSDLVQAAAQGTGAEIAAIWLPARGGTLVARAVWASSGSLAAELEGRRTESVETAATLVSMRFEGEIATLNVPLDTPGTAGALELARRGGAFDDEATLVATLAADLAALSVRLCEDGPASRREGSAALDVAGDALAAVADDEGAAGRVARLATLAAGAEAALVWRLRAGHLEVEGVHGPIEPDAGLEKAARSTVEEQGAQVALVGDSRAAETVTLQLGQPPFGALQLRFPPGRSPDEHVRAQLASFAVRAAHALRSSERARETGFELERSRALLSVVGEAIARLSLSHTLDTAIERVAELLGADRVAVYLREEGRTVVAASRGVEGPHAAIADALLAAALRSRQGGTIVEVDDAATDERLAAVHPQVGESSVHSALALPLVVGDEPIGVLAVYPRLPRPLSANESALLVALAAQLAVLVQNARLHERAQELSSEREKALASEREAAKRLHALYEISRSFAQSLSLETTLDVLAESIVTLLGVDAAVIRMPDDRGVELVARCGARERRAHRRSRACTAFAAAATAAPRPARPARAQRAAPPGRRPGRSTRRRHRAACTVPAQGVERGHRPDRDTG